MILGLIATLLKMLLANHSGHLRDTVSEIPRKKVTLIKQSDRRILKIKVQDPVLTNLKEHKILSPNRLEC